MIPLMSHHQGVRGGLDVAFLGFMTSYQTTRPEGLKVGDLAFGIGGQNGFNNDEGQINLGGGAFSSLHGASSLIAKSRIQWRILTAADVNGTGFSVTGTDSVGAVACFRIGDKTHNHNGTSYAVSNVTRSISTSRTFSGGPMWAIDTFFTSEGSNVENITHTHDYYTWDASIIQKHSTLDTSCGMGLKFFPSSQTVTTGHTVKTSKPQGIQVRSSFIYLT